MYRTAHHGRRLRIAVDFGRKTWRARFSGKVDPSLAPSWGAAKIAIKVGGELWYSTEQTIEHYTSRFDTGR